MSYGASAADVYRQLASFSGPILKGAKPADNLAATEVLGIDLPSVLLALADEMIE